MTIKSKKKMSKLGSGERFKRLEAKVAEKANVDNPKAVAAASGRKKYGTKKMSALAAKGRKK